jgi:hypothetical protein
METRNDTSPVEVYKRNLKKIEERIANTAKRSGRDLSEIRLVVVTKTHPPETIRTLYELHVRDFGENYVTELYRKAPLLPHDITWHLIGPIQRRYFRKLENLDLYIHTLHTLDLLPELSRVKNPPFLVQINIGKEPQKSGIFPEEVIPFVEKILLSPYGKQFRGFMTIPPYREDPEEERIFYRKLRKIKDEVEKTFSLPPLELSMGMSHDFEVAVEEGATFLRIGEAILGPRRR